VVNAPNPAPTRTSYTFAGWYTDAAFTSLFYFGGTRTSNLTLYAKWILTSTINSTIGGTNSASKMVMTYQASVQNSLIGWLRNDFIYYISNYHNVSLNSYYIGAYEVTQEQFQSVMNKNPSYFQGNSYLPAPNETQAKRPVESVTWYDAIEFCNTLSTKEGLQPVYTLTNVTRTSSTSGGSGSVSKITAATVSVDWTKNGYRLPTEMEYEVSGTGGENTVEGYRRYFYPGTQTCGTAAWYADNSANSNQSNARTTHEVGKRLVWQNRYDLCGNVSEWCWDYFAVYTADNKTNPRGPTTGTNRVQRGGSYAGANSGLGMTYVGRNEASPGSFSSGTGFRVARNAD
jgi:uncharacterized repeat protein (TIGR02543 family)